MLTGIIIGLCCASCQASSYIFSRWFISKSKRSPLDLLILSHIIMGGVSLLLLPFAWVNLSISMGKLAFLMLTNTIAYLIGQAAFFMALKTTEASRVSPLLGIKVLMVALLAVCVTRQSLSINQGFAVISCVAAVILLNWSGERIPLKSFLWIVLTCAGYAGSDICGQLFIDFAPELTRFHRSALFVLLDYSLSGIFCLILLFIRPKVEARNWLQVVPFTVVWYASMFLLFWAMAHIGVINAIIVQSTRGLISIIIAVFISKLGYEYLESRMTARIFIQRVIAAILMVVAIVLFY